MLTGKVAVVTGHPARCAGRRVEAQIPDQARSRGISEEAVIRYVLLAAQPTKRFVTVEEPAGVVDSDRATR